MPAAERASTSDLWDAVASVAVAPVPAQPPSALDGYVDPVLAADGQVVSWRFDWPAVVDAVGDGHVDVYSAYRAWRDGWELLAPLGTARDVRRFAAFAGRFVDASQLRCLAGLDAGGEVFAPAAAAELAAELAEVDAALAEVDTVGWLFRDLDRDVVVFAGTKLDGAEVLTVGADWSLSLWPSDGLRVHDGDTLLTVASWELAGDEILVRLTDGSPRLLAGPAGRALFRLAAGSAQVRVEPAPAREVYATVVHGLRRLARTAADTDEFLVIRRAETARRT